MNQSEKRTLTPRKLRTLMRSKNIRSLNMLSLQSGVAYAALWKFCCGVSRSFSAHSLRRLAAVLGEHECFAEPQTFSAARALQGEQRSGDSQIGQITTTPRKGGKT